MMKIKKALSVLLALTFIFSLNIMSASQPTLQKLFSNVFTVNSLAVDDVTLKYAPEGTQNMALKASVTASSCYTSEDGKWNLARINDGVLTYNGNRSGFSTATNEVTYSDTMTDEEKQAAVDASKVKEFTMTFDLEGFYNISRVAMFTFGAFPDTFEIQVSEDGVTYTTVATRSGYAGFNQEALAIDFATVKARFVRIYVTKRGNLDGNNIHFVQLGEVGVYGVSSAPTNSGLDVNSYAPEHCVNLALESTVTVTNSINSGIWNEKNVNDGNAERNGGYTSSEGQSVNDPLNIDFNLGNIADVKRIVFFPNGIAPKSFDIQVSYDGVNYRTVGSGESADKYPNDPIVVELDDGSFASHIRLCVTERHFSESEPYYYVQCAEIGVYGVKNVFDAEINKKSIELVVNDTVQLEWKTKKTNTFLGYEHKIEWTSANEAIATVDKETGLLTGKAVGKTKILATNATLNYSAEVEVEICEKLSYARDKLTISIFSPPTGDLFTDEHYKRVAEADIDLLINSYNVSTLEDNLKMLELARNNGMNSIVADSRLWAAQDNISKELAEEVYADYKGISNLEGVYLYDEPWNANIYADSAENLADVMPGSFVYLNYFPGFIYNSYEQYEYTYDDLAAITDGKIDMMFDVYPFMADGTTHYQRLFDSLNSIRRSGLKYDVKTAACLQTLGYGPAGKPMTNRIPTEADVRYQSMAYLAYGIKHLAYWKYSSSIPNGREDYTDCAIKLDGTPTDVYYHMQKVNPVTHTIGETLINCDAKEVYIAGPDTYGQTTVPSTFFVQPAKSSQSLILSYLQHKETGRNYLMVVNNDLENTINAPLIFASGINSVELLNNNDGTWSGSTISGSYNVTLEPGGAALIALPENYRYAEAQPEAGTNPAYHKTVYGDSSIGTPGTRDEKLSGWYLSCLTDGYITANPSNGLNGWCSELSDTPYETYVKVDLGTQQSISTLSLYAVDDSTGYNGYFPKSYTVSVSTDGENWTPVASETNVTVTDYMSYSFDSVNARYIRVDVSDMHEIDGIYAAAMAEIEINGKPSIMRHKLVANGMDGFYVYMYCENTDYIKVPTWTDYNDRDDIIWHDGEGGSWIINGFKYNFRAYIPVSQHNNEHGRYTVHLYAYNSMDNTSRGTYFEFGSSVLFDLNYQNVSTNLMMDLDNLTSSNGITATYNKADDTVTLNGTLTNSFVLQDLLPVNAQIESGDTIRVTLEAVSGTATNPVIVLELYNDAQAYPDGKRTNVDMNSAGIWDIPVTSANMANEISLYKFWIYKSTADQSYDNFKFKIKLEVVSGGDSVYSPSGRSVGYGETFGELPTPTRNDAEFLGWFTEPTGGTQVTSSTVNTATSATTLYAHWAEVETQLFYGLYAGITAEELEEKYLDHTNVTYSYELMNDTEYLGSGTFISATDNSTGKVIAKYSIVIFGDINGDGWYDGQDAVYCDAIAKGMLDVYDVGEARMMAADCNHDGAVNMFDTRLLNKAGLLLESVDQNLPIEELEASSEWQEYISIIDQIPEEEQPEQPQEEQCFIVRLFEAVINFFKRIIDFIF